MQLVWLSYGRFFQHNKLLSVQCKLRFFLALRRNAPRCSAPTGNGARQPKRGSVSRVSPPKIARRKRAKSSIAQPWIIRFRSNFVQSLNTWRAKCCKSSRSRGEVVEGQTLLKLSQNRAQHVTHCSRSLFQVLKCNNSAADCSIPFKFGVVSSRHRRYTANVQGQRSKVKVTA